jgi:hypothetical protein
MKIRIFVSLLMLSLAVATKVSAYYGEDQTNAKAPRKALTVSSAKSLLRNALNKLEISDIKLNYSLTSTSINTLVRETSTDKTYIIEFPYENIKSIEWESENILMLIAKDKSKILRKEGYEVRPHEWSQWTIVFDPAVDKEGVDDALEFLADNAK